MQKKGQQGDESTFCQIMDNTSEQEMIDLVMGKLIPGNLTKN